MVRAAIFAVMVLSSVPAAAADAQWVAIAGHGLEASDTDIARLGFPAYHQRPSAPTNLTLHQAIDINVPIGCGDAPVFPGDVILGDADGVIVIPAALADEIAEEAFEQTAFEDFVAEQVNLGHGIYGLYPPTSEQTLAAFQAWRKLNPVKPA